MEFKSSSSETPLENPGPVQGATPPIGGRGGTQRTQAATQLEDQY
jgi:hypothetical protein